MYKATLNIGSKNYYLKAFILGLLFASVIFVPFIIYDYGYFLYYGDFNVQQIPFYQMVHDAVRDGNFFWSFTTDLGANTIGSYSFYLLGSPFFLLTLPFGSDIVPYLMGPLLILKFGCASLTSYIYLENYVINKDYGIIGSLLYAFSGFSTYNIFFNHFHEAIIVFPLVLWAMDEYMFRRRRGLFGFAVFLSCTFNYYFFVGQAVFCIIYFLIKVYYSQYKVNVKDFLWLLCEAILGVLLSSFLLLPTVLCVMQNPRVNNPPIGWGALLYNNTQRYLHIIECFFFPPDIPARPNFTPNSESKWASLGAWFPLFSMSGVIAFIRLKKKNWITLLLVIMFISSMIPILNSAFLGFNLSYYARWFYMITLIMSLATVLALENPYSEFPKAINLTLIITLVIALPIGLMPNSFDVDGQKKFRLGLMEYADRFWIYVFISVFSLFILSALINLFYRDKKKFANLAIFCIGVISVSYSIYMIALGKSQSYDTHNFIIPCCLNKGRDIDLPDKRNCRIDIYNGMDNQAMYWQVPSIQAFHSIVPGSIMEFYPTVGVKRDVGSRPDTKTYGLRALLSCRWLFDSIQNDKHFMKEDNKTLMPGWNYYDEQNGFYIYENEYYIPFGFSYKRYMTLSEYDSVKESNRHLAILKAIVLDEQSIHRNADILESAIGSEFRYKESEYFEDCIRLQQSSCHDFSRDNLGFTAYYDAGDKDELVFFSVPFENGWRAYINGEEAIIEKANIGFMAVRVKAGRENKIRFEYETPGLKEGLHISLGSAILFLIYLINVKSNYKRKSYKLKDKLF